MNKENNAGMQYSGLSAGISAERNEKTSALQQPIDTFFNEQRGNDKSMMDNFGSFANLLSRLDNVANRLAPNEYYGNQPSVLGDSKSAPEELPFEYSCGGIFSGFNEVMGMSRNQERELRRQIDDLRRKVAFLESFI